MGDYAASGGYYVSLPANKIHSTPYTITGSIGVVSMFMDMHDLLKKHGIFFETIKKYSTDDMFHFGKKPSIEELTILKRSSSLIYEEFINHVAENRSIQFSQIPYVAEGRIWSGAQAEKLGLTDGNKSLYETIQEAIKYANLSEHPQIIEYPQPKSLIESLSEITTTKTNYYGLTKDPMIQALLQQLTFYAENSSKPALYLPLVVNE